MTPPQHIQAPHQCPKYPGPILAPFPTLASVPLPLPCIALYICGVIATLPHISAPPPPSPQFICLVLVTLPYMSRPTLVTPSHVPAL